MKWTPMPAIPMQCPPFLCNAVESYAMQWNPMHRALEPYAMQWNPTQCNGILCNAMDSYAMQWNPI